MKFIRTSQKKRPKVSLILLDWNVRESFHICHYLAKQTVPRETFEVNVLEYYNVISDAAEEFEEQIDHWLLLEMPSSCYYHKHLMYNIGALISQGEILVICDSDAMLKPTFIESIITTFEKTEDIVLHLDQFRNKREDFYPFNYPSFSDITGKGCINYHKGLTTGIVAQTDILHKRNYGACFCCTKKDFLAIGGADEHIDFIGHICGPYDLTFRLVNLGKEEVWHKKEFLYHTFHPGTDGKGEYLGPHDGYNMSLTSLESFSTKRVEPHVSNPLIDKLKKGKSLTYEEIMEEGITAENIKISNLSFLKNRPQVKQHAFNTYKFMMYYNLLIKKSKKNYSVYSNIQDLRNTHNPLFSHPQWKKTKQFIKNQHQSSFFQNKHAFFWILVLNKIWKRYFFPSYNLILKFFKRGLQFFLNQKQYGSYIDRTSSFHFFWWNYINKAYANDTPSFFVTNQMSSLKKLKELLQLKTSLSLKKKSHIHFIFLKDQLKSKKIKRTIKNLSSSHIYLLREALLDWESHGVFKNLDITII